jgi:hypothetical protein
VNDDKKMQRMLVGSDGLMGAMLKGANPGKLQNAAAMNPVIQQMMAAQAMRNAQIIAMQNAEFAAMQNAQLAAMQNQAVAAAAKVSAAARKQQAGAR